MEIDADAPSNLDRIVQENGGDADADDDDEEWMETDDTQDTDAGGKEGDDASTGMGSDDELECDFNELEENGKRQSAQYGGGISVFVLGFINVRLRPDGKGAELSDAGKEHLTWRLEKGKSFSDWTIVVRSAGSIEPVEYNVHRHMLATGPRKSGYFETMLLSSGQYQESGNSMSTIELPADVVSAFPTFLDYFYAPFSEAKGVITQENWMQLRHLADYFLVSELSNAVSTFIESDMNNLERTEMYLKMAVEEGNEALIAHAATVCITDILHIKEDSSLVYSMPPAFFWHVMVYSSQFLTEIFRADLFQRDDLGRHGRDLGLPYFLGIFDQIVCLMPSVTPINCHNAVAIVNLFLDLFKENNWEIMWFPRRDDAGFVSSGQEVFEAFCVKSIYDYSTQGNMNDLHVAIIMKKVPDYIAKELFIMASRKIRDGKRENTAY